jgi:hypothetical protein
MRLNGFFILVLLALAAGPAWAAPLSTPATPNKPVAAEEETEPVLVPSAMDLPAAKVPGTNRTIDLLLEMQSKDPGAPAPADTAQSARSKALARSANTNSAAANRMLADEPTALGVQPVGPASAAAPVMFGSDTAPAPIRATTPSSSEWQATQGAGGGRSRSDEAPRRWVLIAPGLVLWLRQNRDWVIGGAVLTLALMWGVSAVFSRRSA